MGVDKFYGWIDYGLIADDVMIGAWALAGPMTSVPLQRSNRASTFASYWWVPEHYCTSISNNLCIS